MSEPRRIVIGMTGASGVAYGIRALELLAAEANVETHLVVTAAARVTVGLETGWSVDDVEALADVVHPIRDISAGPASGSFPTSGMLIAPCSIRALSAIAHSHSADLLTRTADVTLKERRPLVLMVRETPLHLGHLRLMAAVTEIGGVIFPPVPAFYEQPADLEALVTGTAARALAQLGMEVPGLGRWEGPVGSPAPG
ncbi:MAG: UbiX family flavin prenyltransferase [Acidimicrobiales bacterium]|nr:UbiX family flavin prenyltransferase [Acidimicrobiales bacterium]|tara:strand:+ start:3457 stop:4050 length:594 start_codon:yes stop_codon:yes gene_type:complete